ncbi:MAG: MFS transporter [Candidatus Methanoperedens sp.]
MRLNALQLFSNTAVIMSVIFIPVLADNFGASGIGIGLIGAAYGSTLFISTYIFSRAADSYPPKKLMYAGFLSACVTYFLQVFAYDLLSLGVIRALAGFSAGIYPAALLLYVYNLKRNVGKFISFMPLGWAFGFLAAGIIAVFWQIFTISSLLFAAAFLITLTLPGMEIRTKRKADYFSPDILRKNWNIYLAFFLRQMGANNVWIVFPLYLLSLGASELWVGIIYMINPIMQFFIMRRLDRYRNTTLVSAGYLLSAAAFLAFLPLTNFYQAAIGMVLIAFSFSSLYVGSTNELIERNEEKGTSAGLLNSTFSLSIAIGSLMGGIVLEFYNYSAVMAMGALMSLAGYAVFRLPNNSRKSQKSY